MIPRPISSAILIVLFGAVPPSQAAEESRPAGGKEAPSFERDVAPILAKRCAGCHGPEEEKAGLDVTLPERLVRGGKSGPAIVRGKSAESLLVTQITRTDAKVMPPPKAGKPLSAEEVALIRAWIDGGARAESARPAAPETARPPRAAGLELSPPEDPGPVASVAFSPGSDLLLLGRDRIVSVLEAESGKEIARLEGLAEIVRSLAFSKDGARVAAAGGLPGKEGEVLIFGAPPTSPWKLAGAIRGHSDAIHAVAFTGDGARIVTAGYDRLIKLWDAASLAETATLKDHLDAVFAVAVSPDGSRAFSASGDRTVKVWDLDGAKRLLTLSDATLGLNSVALAPSGSIVAAGGEDRMIRMWQIEDGAGVLLHSFFAHQRSVLRIAFSPDGKSFYSAGEDGLLKAWRVEGLAERLLFEKQPDWVLGLAVRPDGRNVAVGRHDGSWAVYDADSGKKLLGSDVPPAAVTREVPGASAAGGDEKAAAGDPKSPDREKKKRGLLVDVVDAGNVTVPPSLGGHWPRAVRRGGKATLSIDGRNLGGAEIAFFEPGFTARVVKNETLPRPEFRRQPGATGAEIVDLSTPHKLEVEVEIAADARPGMHRFLAQTPGGATNALALFVEHLGEANESEPNDALAEAGELSAAALAGEEVVLGSMQKSGDADVFRFDAKDGDEVVFHILSQSIGSGLNGLLEVLGPDGTRLATSAEQRFGNLVEGRVAHRFEKAGRHFLRITDKSFAAGGFYRLYAGASPFVTSVFPPGLQAGTKTRISVKGFNLRGGMHVEVEAPAGASGATVPLPIPGAIGGASVAVGEAPEAVEKEPNDSAAEAERIEAPVTVNGVMEKTGGTDEDFFVFHADRGRELIIDVVASRIGSLLDSVIEVLDPAGRPIERATLRSVAQTFVTLSDRDARNPGLRLDSQADLRVNDFIMVGSEVLKIRQLPDYPDEDTFFFGQGGVRAGYLDTTPEFHAVNDPVYKIEIHPPGTEFPPNGMPVFHLAYRNDDGGPPVHDKDSRIHFTAPASGDYVIRLRDIQGRTGPDFYYRLQLREPRPDFQFSVGVENINIPREGRVPFTVSATRLDDFNGPIEVALDGELPAGFTLETAPILPDANEAVLTIKAGPEAQSTPLDRTFRLRARAVAGGRELMREGSFRMVRVVGPPDLVVTMEPQVVRLKPGATADVTVRAVRQNGFEGRIPLEVPNLPHGVAVMDTGLNDILIPEHEDVRVYRLRAETWAAPIERRIYTIGRTETTSPLPTKFSSEPATLVIEGRPVAVDL